MRSGTGRGFALAEIVIVLVIVGLLVGGTLKTQQWLTSARVARVEADFQRTSAAVLAYQQRYGALPGDDPAAATRFPGDWQPGDNGNGDDRIDGPWDAPAPAAESRKLWKHLRAAGLLQGPVDRSAASYAAPRHAFGGPVGVAQGMYGLPGAAVAFGALPGPVAAALDARGDDGTANRGAIRSGAGSATYPDTTAIDLAFGF